MASSPFIITSEELKNEWGKVKLLDVREPDEWNEGRLETAVLIPLGEVTQDAPKKFQTTDNIVVYCAHGVRSLHALMGMKKMGFEHVRSLEGGICAWLESGGKQVQ